MKRRTLIEFGIVAICAAPGMATATDGYFSHGYGMEAKGMKGAADVKLSSVPLWVDNEE